jgi:hypothetical protein
MSVLAMIFKGIASFFVGGSLEKILDVIEHKIDDETKKEEIKAEVTKKWIDAQAALLVGRTWWFQLFLVIPLALHWTAINWVSTFPMFGWTVHHLPPPFYQYEGWIISALFLVDGGKALIGRFKQ